MFDHDKLHENLWCKFCCNLDDLLRHVYLKHKHCIACNESFEDVPGLVEHLEKTHEKKIKCELCPYYSFDPKEFEKHVKGCNGGQAEEKAVQDFLDDAEPALSDSEFQMQMDELSDDDATFKVSEKDVANASDGESEDEETKPRRTLRKRKAPITPMLTKKAKRNEKDELDEESQKSKSKFTLIYEKMDSFDNCNVILNTVLSRLVRMRTIKLMSFSGFVLTAERAYYSAVHFLNN